MTLQQIKDSLPKWILLAPGQVWKRGDESLEIYTSGEQWELNTYLLGHVVGGFNTARRPIPDEVLESQAFWVLYNQLATVAPDQIGYEILFDGDDIECFVANAIRGIRKFSDETEARRSIELLGGAAKYFEQFSQGNLYDKFLGEQIQ